MSEEVYDSDAPQHPPLAQFTPRGQQLNASSYEQHLQQPHSYEQEQEQEQEQFHSPPPVHQQQRMYTPMYAPPGYNAMHDTYGAHRPVPRRKIHPAMAQLRQQHLAPGPSSMQTYTEVPNEWAAEDPQEVLDDPEAEMQDV
ncbi:hypothetical protein C0991_000822 [Blastosporella zonata]|nr:hypothetical protein C0991_000822 [Blastosporella zonata]